MSTPQDTPNGQGDGQGWNPPGNSSGGRQNPYAQPSQYGQQGQQGQQGHFGQQDQPSPYGYPAGPASGYAYPTNGSDPKAGPDKGPVPTEVMRAYYLILAAGALYLVATILATLTASADVAVGGPAFAAFTIVLAVLAAAIYVVLAVFIRKGHNWARITATVLSGLNVLSTLSVFLLLPLTEQMAAASGQAVPETPGLTIAFSVIVMLLGVAGVVMTYLKSARPYFAPRRLGY